MNKQKATLSPAKLGELLSPWFSRVATPGGGGGQYQPLGKTVGNEEYYCQSLIEGKHYWNIAWWISVILLSSHQLNTDISYSSSVTWVSYLNTSGPFSLLSIGIKINSNNNIHIHNRNKSNNFEGLLLRPFITWESLWQALTYWHRLADNSRSVEASFGLCFVFFFPLGGLFIYYGF